jgi:ketosteroid isomerase-like protein
MIVARTGENMENIMINVDRSVEVNPLGTLPGAMLDRDDVWAGLMRKAENAVPFVKAISDCRILEHDATGFVREVVVHGEAIREHVTFHPKDRVTFKRLSGSAMGTIENRIEEQDGQLTLRFVFELELAGADAAQEAAFRDGMAASYLDAVQTTLDRIRAEKSDAVRDRFAAMFAAIDAQDGAAFLTHLTPDATFTFGNMPATRGAEAILAAFDGFLSSIRELRHEILTSWAIGEVWIVEQRVHYVDQWGREHDLPCTNILRTRDGLVADYRIYMDVSPLFQPPAIAA